MKLEKWFFLVLYYVFAANLPRSTLPFIGPASKWFRYMCCKHIFKYCGANANIERKAYFGKGFDVEIGDNSGIGYRCVVPSNIKIGSCVMMAPEVFIGKVNHAFDSLSKPMCFQGTKMASPVKIKDDVWIGRRVIINPGRIIEKGSIVASGTVLVRDYPEFSIVGGNPSRVIGNRRGSSMDRLDLLGDGVVDKGDG